ncbi:RND transporter [Sediminicola sp. YIK13]|uniref:efflux RND transporter periplasmic adaptor subunit n=1 Tax=Sediminicola sp. YIK13 TaxID=1453352 RepID=UPI000721C0CB|nr:efflux RND transporter periplasmic adaptor subunit [Sediminicola sp. YIK13]ALM07453.1 RND transporter [Sediminicola sp. YIK13]
MKNKTLYIVLAALAGLLAGYFIFGGINSNGSKEEHDHTAEMANGEMWTCSMHPQIMQPEPGDCPICGMDLIPAESGADGLASNQFKMTKNAMALANIETMVVGAGNTKEGVLTLSGKIMENEEINGTQAAYFGGRVEKLNVNYEGEEIKKGQLLATIYSPELVSAQQELLTATRLKESQPELYKAVRNKLKLWKLSEKQIAQIENSDKVTENFPVYANTSGTVSKIMVEEGDYIKQGAALFSIADLSSVWAVFDSYENQVGSLKNNQAMTIVANSYPNTKFKAKISFIDPILNSSKRTVEVRAVLQNKDGLLKPGMFVQGSIMLSAGTMKDRITIPESAILWTGERSVVYVKTDSEEPVFEMREVTLGTNVNGSYEVLDGLENGTEIVANGTFTVDAAAQLKGKKSMMNQEGGKTMTGHEGHTGVRMEGTDSATSMKMDIPKEVQKDIMSIIGNYMDVKDALVASNPERAGSSSKVALNGLKNIIEKDLDRMTEGHLNKIIEMFTKISKTDNLVNQREYFIILSENLISISTNLKEIPSILFVQNCPMANKNKGADWLSWEKEIRNPYYGEAMMNCGEVKQVISK